MLSEKEILGALQEAELEKKEAKAKLAYHKKEAIEMESRIITASLNHERLSEELRIFYSQKVNKEETLREIEIREFSSRLPNILKK